MHKNDLIEVFMDKMFDSNWRSKVPLLYRSDESENVVSYSINGKSYEPTGLNKLDRPELMLIINLEAGEYHDAIECLRRIIPIRTAIIKSRHCS